MLGDGKNEEKSAKDTENEHSVWKDKEHNCIDLETKWGKTMKLDKNCDKKY